MGKARIVISGTSVFLLAIKARLAALPEVEVVHINPYLPGAGDCIVELEPDVVIVERNGPRSAGKLDLLDHNYPVIELDAEQDVLALLHDCQSLRGLNICPGGAASLNPYKEKENHHVFVKN